MLSGETPRNCSFSFCVMSNACRFAISTSWLNTKARPFRFPGSWSPAGDCACCFEPGERSVATKAFCNALVKLRTCPTNSLTSRLSAAISPRWPVAVLRREVSSPLFSLRAMRATSNRNDSENAVMVGGDVGVGWDADHSNDPVPPGSHQQRHRSKRAYLPAFSALRLAALGSTTALNFAPGTNLGTVDAGIFRAAPVAGFLPVRAARLADLNVPKPTSCTALPFFTAVWMVSISVSRTALAAALDRSFLEARISMSSARFIGKVSVGSEDSWFISDRKPGGGGSARGHTAASTTEQIDARGGENNEPVAPDGGR